jgi:serine/threonine protein kinase
MLYDIESRALKIIDFGTAIKFKKGFKIRGLVGTPYYIAP